jgi:hypothetical protein
MHRMRLFASMSVAAVLLCSSVGSVQAETVTTSGATPDAPKSVRLKRVTVDHTLDGTTFVVRVAHLTRRGVFAFGGAEADGEGYFFVSAFHRGKRVKVASYGAARDDQGAVRDYKGCAGARVRWQTKRHRIVAFVPDDCYEATGSGDLNYEVDSFIDRQHWRVWDQADTTPLSALVGVAAG